MDLVYENTELSLPLSVKMTPETIYNNHFISGKLDEIQNNLRHMLIKLAQRNQLKQEFIKYQKAIDRTPGFCRTLQMVNTQY